MSSQRPQRRPEERVTISAPGRTLEGLLVRPATTGLASAVLCHPHPQYMGSMDNPVIVAVANALARRGLMVLRFNFGGVGRSQGAYSGGPGEVEDARAAIAAVARHLPRHAPLSLVGYSFGAWVALLAAAAAPRVTHVVAIAPPLSLFDWTFLDGVPQAISIIAAEHDQFSSPQHLERLLREHAGHATVWTTIAGADHFFLGLEGAVAAACTAATTELPPRPPTRS